MAVLKFPSGALGTWTSCFSARYQGPALRIYGSKATAELYWAHPVLRTGRGKETRFETNAAVAEALGDGGSTPPRRGRASPCWRERHDGAGACPGARFRVSSFTWTWRCRGQERELASALELSNDPFGGSGTHSSVTVAMAALRHGARQP